jgi:protein gp37
LPVRFRDDRIELLKRTRKPTAFALWSDLFHEEVPDLSISAALHMAGHEPRHRLLVLTKRAERMAAWSGGFGKWPRNVWAGATVCNQAEADAKIPLLLQVPAAVRFLSIEPMLGPINLCPQRGPSVVSGQTWDFDFLRGQKGKTRMDGGGIHWVIVGGETGAGARPMHPDWARSIRDQCAAAGVPFLFKHRGEWSWMEDDESGLDVPMDWREKPSRFHCLRRDGTETTGYDGEGAEFVIRVGKRAAGRLLDGREHSAIPKMEGKP